MSKKLNQQQKDLVTEAFYRKRSGESYISISESFGIDRRTLFSYRNSEEGQQIEKELRQNLIEQSYEAIMETVIDKARLGSFQHAKLYMQITGKLKSEEVNVKKELNVTKETTPELLAQLDELLKN
ncbi:MULTISPECIES: phBC6A51 family helix-turn-helix protein [Bacillus]|uniref:phBC6A51 family helix-turn-helix protein n=1 Tax=Bacillus TaxID=1386 RepID=UPI002111CAC4|nr:phBC6A51 family helix-turn-helix protein [Bacillus paranthracis]MCQ6520067.1 phBC6A51 family helix-turn-helix protein [Bacillus paranthracis]MCU5227272.1 phBC6A51 family helix-turn-helix protein [Bacillus paranthracis]MEC4603868.1 phBC6A51 family helix-turn-helix protein [Bacillus paranthracis]